MRFSFVVPVYGTEQYLPRCLDSIRDQTCDDYEVIVVDDCSPSKTTSDIVARYDERFKCIVHDRNRSAFQARRTAIMAARGDYVIPVDPDDYILPELLAKAIEVLDASDPDMISYWMDYDNGKKIYPHWCRHSGCVISASEALRELAAMKFFTGVASKILRRSTLNVALERLSSQGDLYVNISDDFLMLAPFLMCSDRVAFITYAGYRYFVNPSSATSTWNDVKGFEAACQQTGVVVRLVDDFAKQTFVTEDVRETVATAAVALERFFVRAGLTSAFWRMTDLQRILLCNFKGESVASETLAYIREVGESRVYRLFRYISGILRMVRSGVKG